MSFPKARAELAEAIAETLNPLEGPRLIPLPKHMADRVKRLERAIDRLIAERLRMLIDDTHNAFEAYEKLRGEHTQEALE